MAQLQSPGVSVTVIDESFYTPSAPGTVPLIVVASAENKQNGSGTGIAPGTLKANAGQVYLLTSQKDLSDTFGTPIFQTNANNNPVHAGELNEYGLQAAYSFLGVSNSAYVVRADIDLSQLEQSADAPAGLPVDGTVWIDTANTQYGIFQWDANPATVAGGQTFTVQTPSVITDPTYVVDFNGQDYTPKASFGAIGSYAIVAVSGLINLWFKKPATTTASGVKWVEVGTDDWISSWPIAQGSKLQSEITVGSTNTLTINNTTIVMTNVTDLNTLVTAINAQTTTTKISAGIVNNKLQLFSTGPNLVITGTAATATGILATGETTGTFLAPALQISSHTQIPLFKAIDNTGSKNGVATGAVWIKTTTPNSGAHWFVNQYNSKAAQWISSTVSLYANNIDAINGLDAIGGGINLPINTMYVKYNDSGSTITQNSVIRPQYADFKLYRRANVGPTTITSAIITNSTFSANTYTFTLAENNTPAKSLSFSVSNGDTAVTVIEEIVSQINSAGFTNIVASSTTTNQVVISHIKGGEITVVDGTNTPVSKLYSVTTTANFYADPSGVLNTYIASNWSSVSSSDKTKSFAIASSNAPTTITANGQLWYNGNIEDVDILVHDGTTWVGYRNANLGNGIGATDSYGPIVSATAPTTQSDGLTELKNGDLWISTADLENYPLIYKYDYLTKQWVLVDNSDQTTENGILFHDARWDVNGQSANSSSIVELLTSDFLDPDAPNPALYPKGMLLWNLRRSGFNIKKYVYNYIDVLSNNQRYNNDELMTNYYPHRWVSEAANQADGSGSFGRIAQRVVVLQSLTELVNSNQQIRDEDNRIFNLIAAPGYPELIKPLIGLNYDRGLTAFIIGDTPARLTPDATTLNNWGKNVNNALEDNSDGLVSTDPYLGVFYPWGYTTDNIGNNITVPPSHMMLRTIALSDNVSYPWFAPAGVRRGGITNASAVGYIDAEGEFRSVALNNGQRDTLSDIHVNPITYISGTGLVNYGQKTRQLVASSLDRINVARLVIYLRVQLARIAKPYIFEPNDTITRNEIKQQIESFLLELVGQRALYDYLVVCDTSNNTPSRIDANELYVDIAIEPVKAVEFIYIPLRLENTGAIAKLGQS